MAESCFLLKWIIGPSSRALRVTGCGLCQTFLSEKCLLQMLWIKSSSSKASALMLSSCPTVVAEEGKGPGIPLGSVTCDLEFLALKWLQGTFFLGYCYSRVNKPRLKCYLHLCMRKGLIEHSRTYCWLNIHCKLMETFQFNLFITHQVYDLHNHLNNQSTLSY